MATNTSTIGSFLRNMSRHTEDLGNTGHWTKFGTVTVANEPTDPLAPDGTATADKVSEVASGGVLYHDYVNPGDLVDGQAYTFSIFAYPGTSTEARVHCRQTGTDVAVQWTPSTGALTAETLSLPSSVVRIHACPPTFANPTGWFRVEVTFTYNDGGGTPLVRAEITPAVGAATGDTYFWGAQFEQNDHATAYQPQTDSGGADAWTGDYATISAWEAATDTDLVTAGNIEVGELLPGRHIVNSPVTFAGAVTNASSYRHLRTASADKYLPDANGPTVIEYQWASTGDESAFTVSEAFFRMSDLGFEFTDQRDVTSGFKVGIDVQEDNFIAYQSTLILREGFGDQITVAFTGINIGTTLGPAYVVDFVLRELVIIGESGGVLGADHGIFLNTFTKRGEIYGCVTHNVDGAGTSYGIRSVTAFQNNGLDNVKVKNCICLGSDTCITGVMYSDDSSPLTGVVKGFGNCVVSDDSIFATNFTGDGSFADPDVVYGQGAHFEVAGFMPGAIWGASPSQVFVDADSQDFHLLPSSPALDAGADLSTEFTDATKGPGSSNDYGGSARSGLWDVGLYAGFAQPTTTPRATHTSKIGSAQEGRHFLEIQDWIDSLPTSLPFANVEHIAELYGDSDFTPDQQVRFIGIVTTKKRSLTLRAASASRYRPHGGGVGAQIAGGAYGTTYTSLLDMRVRHVTLEGVLLDVTPAGTTSERAVHVYGKSCSVDSVFVKFDSGTGAKNTGIAVSGADASVRNSVVQGRASSSTKGMAEGISLRNDKGRVLNCIVDSLTMTGAKGVSLAAGAARALVANTVSYGTGTPNMLSRTESFDHADWQKVNSGTVTADAVTPVAPDGTTTADLLTDTDAVNIFECRQTFTPGSDGLVPGDDYTLSCHIEQGSSDTTIIRIVHADGSSAEIDGTYTWSTGLFEVTLLNGAVGSGSVESVSGGSGGWKRIQLTIEYVDGAGRLIPGVFPSTPLATKTSYFWGAQFEHASSASPYQANLTIVPTAVDFSSASVALDAVLFACSSGDGTAVGFDAQRSIDEATEFSGESTNDYRLGASSIFLDSGFNALRLNPSDFIGASRTAPMTRGVYEGFFAGELLAAPQAGDGMASCHLAEFRRVDGITVRITSNSEPVQYDGHTFYPDGGARLSARRSEVGIKPTTQTATGAINANRVTAQDLAAGRYDGAKVTVYLIDPVFPFARYRKRWRYTIGSVSHTDLEWEVNLEGVLSQLKRRVGGLVTLECDYDLGDDLCGVVLDGDIEGDVRAATVTSQRIFTLESGDMNDSTVPDDWFGNGKALALTGLNAGLEFVIKEYTKATLTVELAVEAPLAIAVGDRFQLKPGCRHRWTDCDTKWANTPRYGGNEALPGGDRALETSGK